MTVDTDVGSPIEMALVHNYFSTLVNHFFKILPIRESEEASLPIYMRSLQVELLGCQEFIPSLRTDAAYLTLLSILQYLINNPACEVKEVKREVFRAIKICNRLKDTYKDKEVSE